jgi:hypothetical protein
MFLIALSLILGALVLYFCAQLVHRPTSKEISLVKNGDDGNNDKNTADSRERMILETAA